VTGSYRVTAWCVPFTRGSSIWKTAEYNVPLKQGLPVDMESTHPKMGFLVQEAAQRSGMLLMQKQRIAGDDTNLGPVSDR